MDLKPNAVRSALRVAADNAFKELRPDWTIRVLQALADLTPDACVDPDVTAPRVGRGRIAKEHLWDLTISSWPRYKEQPYKYPDYFAAARKPRLLLVAESEWGDERDRRKNGYAVLDDFTKLLAARAPLKVMVFGYFVHHSARSPGPRSSFDELSDHMVNLVDRSKDDANYVLFGVAWDEDTYEDALLVRGTLTDRRKRA